MQPESIRRFSLFYLAALAVSLIAPIIGFESVTAQVGRETASLGYAMGPAAVLASIAVGIAVTLLLWYLVARKGSVIAKWIVVLLFLFNLMSAFRVGKVGLTLAELSAIVALVLQAAAVWYLFRPDAKAWFGAKDAAEDDPGRPVPPPEG